MKAIPSQDAAASSLSFHDHVSGREKEEKYMKTVRVYRLHPSPTLFGRLKAAQREAAAV
jgi:hypothetical protein